MGRSLPAIAALAALAASAGCGGGSAAAPGAGSSLPAPAPAAPPSTAPAVSPSPAAAVPTLAWGVNIHDGSDDATNAQVAGIMRQRHLTTARMDLAAGDPAALRAQVQEIRANGGRVEVSVQPTWQWDTSCNPDLAFVEQDAHDQTVALVDPVKDIVQDFELLNETQLRSEIQNEVPWESAGTSTAPYAGKPCVATLAAVLRGMSRAIADLRASSQLPLRTILGEVGRDFGFLAYMQQQGVQWDVTGFHVYPRHDDESLLTDPRDGPGGPLAQLAAFGKPLHINEFNCGEISDAGYEDTPGAPDTEACLQALARHMMDLRNQTIVRLESIHFYELRDETGLAPPQNRFGLMRDLAHPRVQLYLASAFAGGDLTAQERAELTGRGLLTDADIDAMHAAAAAAAASAAHAR